MCSCVCVCEYERVSVYLYVCVTGVCVCVTGVYVPCQRGVFTVREACSLSEGCVLCYRNVFHTILSQRSVFHTVNIL